MFVNALCRRVGWLRLLIDTGFKESLNKLISFIVRRPKEVPVVQAHHERNQPFPVRPELVEGLVQRFLNQQP
jgi:hypothetical protein